MKTKTVAAIDIGSNSLKLVIVKAAASDSFTVILQERERVRLGHETLKTHRLSPEAIDLSAETIAKFRQIAESRDADVILAVATASVREAENSDEFVREIQRQTGVRVEVLSSLEEARLIGVGASQNICNDECSLLNIDIGGGSTELSLMRDGEPHKLFSMKLGAVGLTEKFTLSNPPKAKEIENMRVEITNALDKPRRKINGETWKISTGTSGTILRLASVITPGSEKSPIELKKLSALNEKLTKMTTDERAELPGISRQRAEVVVAGAQILENVMRGLKIETLQPCGFALREGVIIDYLREIEAESLPPVPDVEDKRLRVEITNALDKPRRKINGETWKISTGTSGTILRLASVITPGSEKSPIELKKLSALNEKLTKMTTDERAELPGISRQRAEVVVAGAQILENVMRGLKIETLQPCGFALREGVIIDYLREIEAESLPPVPDVEDKRLRGVFAIGRRFGYEENHAIQIATFAEKIFDALAPIYNLERHHRTLLSAAALLHEVGYHVSHESHHKHTLYLIKHSELIGFSETEKLIIGNAARYHRGSLPKEKHTDFMAMSEYDQAITVKLGGILRLAVALNRNNENRIKTIEFKRANGSVRLKLTGKDDLTAEIQAVELKKDLFEIAFDCELKTV